MKEMQICQIGTADIKHLHSKDIRMVMLAESGAMGEPGVVVIVEKQKSGVRVSHANYCYGDFDMDKFAKVFTPLQTLDCGLFGCATGIASGWHHVDLGAGNHLLVCDAIYKEFAARTKEMSPPEIYQSCLEIGAEILTKRKKNTITN